MDSQDVFHSHFMCRFLQSETLKTETLLVSPRLLLDHYL